MAVYATQLQPYEEHQSPSPTETKDNPYELALTPRRTSSLQARSSGPPSPQATINTLHSTLQPSTSPESPPPAWKRRTTISGRPLSTGSSSPTSPTSPTAAAGTHLAGARTVRSPSDVGPRSSPSPSAAPARSTTTASTVAPPSRRHPSLAMTAAAARVPATSLPNGVSLHESPSTSSTSLGLGEGLTLPNPAFRRGSSAGGNGPASSVGGGGSARSSIISTQDLNSLTSEELWSLGHGGEEMPDMSNPSRQAAERPLDTVRRMSRMVDSRPVGYQPGLPGDVIWPAAPPVLEDAPPLRAKSTTNVPGKRMSIRGRSRRPSADSTASPQSLPRTKGIQSVPVSPVSNTKQQVMLSSAHSSSTSLSSHQTSGGGIPSNKSFPAIGKQPPSTYYSRDFLSSLAPREGGYAIAAQMGGGLGAQGTMAVGEKRRSSYADVTDPRSRSASSRAPLAKSAGMGRWSLDGGENFGRPYATPSAATTSSNLSAPPLTSNISDRDSVSLNDPTPTVPDGAQMPIPTPHGAASVPVSVPGSGVGAGSVPTNAQAPRTPPNPSPLSQQTSAEDVQPRAPAAPAVAAGAAGGAAAAAAAAPALLTKKSKKQLAKETKAAEKLEAQKVARQRAQAARVELQKKQRARAEEQRAKEEAKRREKEEKARRKAAKKAGKSGAPAVLARKAPAAGAGAGQTVLEKQAQQAAEAGPKAEPIPVPEPAAVAMPGAPLAPGASAPPSVQASTTETDLPAPTVTTETGTGSSTPTSSATSFPKPVVQPQIRSSQSAYKVPTKEPLEASTRPSRSSMPAGRLLSSEKPQPQAQAQGAQGAQGEARPKMEVKPKRSFFGTLKKRLSYMGSGDKDGAGLRSVGNEAPPVPALPAAATKREAPAPEATEFGQVPTATPNQEGELVSPPPRRTSLMAVPRHLPPVDTPSKPLSEDVLEAVDESPATIRPPANASLPVPSTPTPSSEQPEAAARAGASPSPSARLPGSPAGSVGRTRTSLIGPRPVPARKTSESRSRSTSINNATSSPGAGLASSVVDNSPLPMPVTPSTSGESALSYVQSHASHNSSMTPVTSPSDTEAESRKPSGEAERVVEGLGVGKGMPFSLGEEVQVPERESSKSSDETVLPERAGQGVLA
ncbi:hypothetical protein IAT38_002667 [Cryptococcus sp. DSM 104549]